MSCAMLRLRRTCAFVHVVKRDSVLSATLLRPEDIMDEPGDLEEHEEPNPIQDEQESDKAGACRAWHAQHSTFLKHLQNICNHKILW